MTPEEVWGEPDGWLYVRKKEAWPPDPPVLSLIRRAEDVAARPFWTETPLYTRTAMEAYAAEKVAEERAAIVAWISSDGGCWPRGTAHATILAQAIAANQHHGGNDADT